MAKKSIAKNYIYNLIYQILILAIPLITIPYLSRVLGPENIGIYGYTLSIATYFILLGTLGISMYAQREFAYVQDDVKKRSILFWEIVIFRFITMLISGVIYYFNFASSGEYSIYFKILLLELFLPVIDITSFYQGLEEFKKVIFRNFIIRILGTICVFLIVKAQTDLYKYILIIAFSNILGNISLWFYLPKYIKKVKLSELNIFRHLKPTIVLFIPQVAIQVYTLLDRTMLGLLVEDIRQVGYYEQSQRIVKVFLTLVTALGIVMIPRIANEFAKKNYDNIKYYILKSFRFVYLLAFPIIFGLITVAGTFVPLFLGEDFNESIQLVQLSSIIILFIGMSHVTGVQYMIPLKKEKQYTISYIGSACVNLVCNLILIPKFYAVGAVVATVIAEFIVIVLQLYFLRNELPIKKILLQMQNYIIASIIMFVVVWLIKDLFVNVIFSMIIQMFVGAVVYIGILFLLKDELLIDGKNKLILKLKK